MTIQEAAQRLSKSEATIRRAIKSKKLIGTIVDGRYDITEDSLVAYADIEQLSMQSEQLHTHSQEEIEKLKTELERLNNDNQMLRHELKQTYEWLKEKDAQIEDSRQRQDSIIMQLSRQLEQSQRMLEAHSEPWYKRWFGKKTARENV